MAHPWTGSLYFGPEPDDTRNYSHQAAQIPASGIFTIAWLGVRIDRSWVGAAPATSSGSIISVWGSGLTVGSTGGNDSWIGVNPSNFGTNNFGLLKLRLSSGGQVAFSTATTGTFASGILTSASAITFNEVWSFAFVCDGANWTLYGCKYGGTVVTLGAGAYNTGFNSKSLAVTTFGKWNFGGRIQAYLLATEAVSSGNFQLLANGTDVETVFATSGNRKDLLELTSPAATITNAWGGGNATRNGTWTGRPTSSPLIPNASAYIQAVSPTPYQPVPLQWGAGPGATGAMALSGTYAGFTPATFQGRVVSFSDNTNVVQDWTNLTGFSASAGSWSGTLAVPAGCEYVIQIRDSVATTTVWNGANPIVCTPVIVTDGQSPMVNVFAVGTGAVAVTGNGYFAVKGFDNATYNLAKYTTAIAGSGLATMLNRFSTLAGATQGLFLIPAAVTGTSSYDWAGVQTMTVSSSAAYTVGETVTCSNGGTAIVTASSGTSLSVKNATSYFGNTTTVVGGTSGVSRTVATQSTIGAFSGTTYPAVAPLIDAAGVPKYLSIWWLNGAADTNTTPIAANHDLIVARYDADLVATRGITYKRVMVPHNRDTGNVANDIFVRVTQRTWATGHALYGSKVFVGPCLLDMITDSDSLSTGTLQSATSTTAVLAASESTVYTTANGIKIVSGTGAGQSRQFTGYVNATKTATVAPWSVTPDATSTYRVYATSPHQNSAGNIRIGSRFGQTAAYRHGFTAVSGDGPSLTSATYPHGGSATTVYADFTHVGGSNLRTANGGTGATTVFGLEGSTDGTIWTRPTAASITNGTRVTLTFASPPTLLRYGNDGGAPVAVADYESLGDLLYDDTAIGDTSGLPAWFTPTNLSIIEAPAPSAPGGAFAFSGFNYGFSGFGF